MSSSSVEKIKENLDIAQVVGAYIKIEKTGGNYKAKCPFHNEKTPSFFISPSRGSYYCFGCGAKGDIFTFVQEFEGIDFVGALKLLADRAGVTLDTFEPKEKGEKDSLYSVLEEATLFYEGELNKNKKALDYLKGRGLNEDTIRDWRLGYAPNDWRPLSLHLKAKGISQAIMARVGLIKKSDKARDDTVYDVFRGRIIFPIFDQNGKVVAFSGRIFDESPNAPKYLNSPETVLFSKSEILYGLHKAKVDIRKKNYAILVEGQMDLLMCHQAGFCNAVASSGTAFTLAQISKLKRLSERIIFVFDADGAGFEAGKKGAELALSLEMEVKLAQLPEGTDPADLIYKDIEAWNRSIKNSKHLIEFYLDKLMAKKLESRQLAKEVEKKVLPYLSKILSAIEQAHFVSIITKRTGIREEAIWNDLRRISSTDQFSEHKKNNFINGVETEVLKRKNYIERRLCGILFWQEGEEDKIIDVDKLRIALTVILGDSDFVHKLKNFEADKEELIFEAESYYGDKDHLQKEIEELLLNLEEDILREKFVLMMNELHQAEEDKDEKRTKELLTACQEISVKLSQISQKRK